MVELPTITQYVDSISSQSGLIRTLGSFHVERNAYQEVRFMAGNNAAVFRIEKDGKPMTLKCYFKSHGNLPEIYDYLYRCDDPLLHKARFLPEEIYVFGNFSDGNYYDVVLADWAEGNSLETEIKRAGNEYGRDGFEKLSASFDKMALELLNKEWSHGDLKPENIIVGDDGLMTLIDYDAMYIPGMKNPVAFEIGTPGYQHPYRDNSIYNKHIDDYPIAMISASLKALACEPELYKNFHRSDIIIMHPEEILDNASEAYQNVMRILSREGFHQHYALALQLNTPNPAIENIGRLMKRIGSPYSAPRLSDDIIPELFEHKGSWGYRHPSGGIIIEPIYDEGTSFREGLAVVRLQGIYHVIATNGDIIIDGKDYNVIKPFSEGKAVVCKNNKWGLIDRSGSNVCGFIFDDAGSLHENRIKVLISDLWGYADADGNIIIKPVYDFATNFRGGKATVRKNGKLLEINLQGGIIA